MSKMVCNLIIVILMFSMIILTSPHLAEASEHNFFQTTTDDVSVYDNRSGSLVEVATLPKGEMYPIEKVYGDNWYKVQFNNFSGYVYKPNTTKISNSNVQTSDYSTSLKIALNKNKVVYDNSGNTLEPFGEIHKGQEYNVISDYGNWWRVKFAGRIGYISKENTQLTFTGSEDVFEVKNDDAPIYDNSTGQLVKVGTLIRGQSYKRIRNYGNWHEINLGNKRVYIHKDQTVPSSANRINNLTNKSSTRKELKLTDDAIVYDNSTGSLIPFATLHKGINIEMVSPYGNWYEVNVGNRLGYINKSSVEEVSHYNPNYFKISVDNAPIYDNRSGKLVKVGELQNGLTYPRSKDYGNWHEIQIGHFKGYVNKKNTEAAYPNNVLNENDQYDNSNTLITVNQKSLIYDNSTGSLKPIGTLEPGVKVKVISNYGNWWRIIYAGQVGYISKSSTTLEFNSEYKVYKTMTNTPIYINSSGNLVKIGTLESGMVFNRVRDYGSWHHIRVGSQDAYVKKAKTEATSRSQLVNPIDEKDIGLVSITHRTPVYDNSGGSLKILGYIQAGQLMSVALDYGNWWQVNYSGREAYINKANTVKVSDIKRINEILNSKNKGAVFQRIRPNLISSSNEPIKSANNILNNQLYLKGYGTIDYSNGIDWNNARVSENKRSFLRVLNGHFFLSELIVAYEETENPKYIIKGIDIVEDWIKNNKYINSSGTMAWHDETTAQRLSQWTILYHYAKDVVSKEQSEMLLESLIFHAELLSTEHFHAKNTNHGMFQDESLLTFTDYFSEYNKSNNLYLLAKNRLKEYFDFIISKNGIHLEHSPDYHFVIANALLRNYEYFTKKKDQYFAEYLINKYNSMSEYATFITKPDGYLPPIGDTGQNQRANTRHWTDNENYQYSATVGEKGNPNSDTSKVYQEEGYAIFRDDWDLTDQANYVLFTAAYHTSYHKHSDDLNLWIYANGHDLIVESGPHGYDYDNKYTEYGYSSFAHNSLIVNDQGLPRHDGQYDQVYIKDYSLDGNVSSVTGINKRFKDLTHERNVVYNQNDKTINITDNITSVSTNDYKLLWHLGEKVTPILEDNTVKLLIDNQVQMEINFSTTSDLDISILKGQPNPVLGWKLDYSSDNKPLNTIVLETKGKDVTINTDMIIK